MATLSYHGLSPSSNAVRLLIVAHALDVRLVEGADGSALPTLVDGTETLSNGRAILEHLCSKHGLVPSKEAAEYLAWHEHHLGRGASAAFTKTYLTEQDHADVDADLQLVEESLKHIETHFLSRSPFLGGDGISIADLVMCSELVQAHYGRLLHDLFNFPKIAAVMQAVRGLPNNAFLVVFRDLDEFSQRLPPVKSAQVTIRGNREVLKNLRGARPKRVVRGSNHK